MVFEERQSEVKLRTMQMTVFQQLAAGGVLATVARVLFAERI